MLIGGYTTAILISDQEPQLGCARLLERHADIWTIPIAGLVAGLAGFLFGFPALRLTGLYLALATFAIAVAAPAVVKTVRGVHRRRRRHQPLRPRPGLTGVDRSRRRLS